VDAHADRQEDPRPLFQAAIEGGHGLHQA
jgi:hypothetical protein